MIIEQIKKYKLCCEGNKRARKWFEREYKPIISEELQGLLGSMSKNELESLIQCILEAVFYKEKSWEEFVLRNASGRVPYYLPNFVAETVAKICFGSEGID